MPPGICSNRVLLLCLLLHAVYANNCRCPRFNFASKFREAHSVVRAFVLSQYTSCHLCASGLDKRNAVRIYRLYTYKKFKGKRPLEKYVFTAQSMDDVNYCGVRLVTSETYMLNLADKGRISQASHWTKGWYVLESCQAHMNWKNVNSEKQKILYRGAV